MFSVSVQFNCVVYAIHGNVSLHAVCLSVSVTIVYCIKGHKHIIKLLSLRVRPCTSIVTKFPNALNADNEHLSY